MASPKWRSRKFHDVSTQVIGQNDSLSSDTETEVVQRAVVVKDGVAQYGPVITQASVVVHQSPFEAAALLLHLVILLCAMLVTW